jgi:hypothetical protein
MDLYDGIIAPLNMFQKKIALKVKMCLREKTPPRLGHLAPASEVKNVKMLKMGWSANSKMVR